MTNSTTIRPSRSLARIAGILYLTIIASGIFAEFFIRQRLIVPGDAATTVSNIVASPVLFRLNIASDLVMLLCDVALALLFYVLLKPVSNALSLLAAFFRLTQAAILGANLLNLFFVLQLVSGADYLAVLGMEQLQAQVLFFLEAHGIGYSIGLTFFGMNCLVLGYLVFKAEYLPKVLGILLIVAGAGYLFDSFALALLPNYAAYEEIFAMVVFAPAIIGEFAMCLWLLIKGVDGQPQAHGSALQTTQARGMGA